MEIERRIMKQRRSFLVCGLSLMLVIMPPALAQPPSQNLPPLPSFDNEDFVKVFNKLVADLAFKNDGQNQEKLWKLMEQLQDAIQRTKDPQKKLRAEFEYSDITRSILRQGTNADYQKLIQIYKNLPADSYGKRLMIQPLLNFWIQSEIETLEKSGVHPTLQISTTTAPDVVVREVTYLSPEVQKQIQEALRVVGPDVQRGWQQYKGVTAKFIAALDEKREVNSIGVQQNWSLLYDAASDFFDGKTQDLVPRLTRLKWGSWCGTRSEQFYDPKYRLLFATLLKEHRYEAAIGALFPLISHSDNWMESFEPNNDWKQRFLRWSGVEWEPLFAGASLEYQRTLDELARYGSPQAALLLAHMKDVPAINERDDYLIALAAFIMQGKVPTGYGRSSSSDIRRQNIEPVPDEVQQQLLKILGDQIRPDTKPRSLQKVTHLLAEKARPESKEAFRRLLEMPYAELRETAALTLRAWGDDVKEQPLKPLTFRLLHNGQAASRLNVKWEIRAKESAIMSERPADENGKLELKHELLVDAPEAPQFRFAAADLKSPDDLWFEVQQNKPADLEKITDVPFETGALTLQLQLPQAMEQYRGKNLLMQVSTERPLSGGTAYFQPINGYQKMSVPVGEQIRFPALQKRTYEIEILVPGAALWCQKIALDADQKTVEVNLQKGADLKFEILAPGGENRDKTTLQTLLRDGKTLNAYSDFYNDYEAKIYRGLPVGNYTLKIGSSAEKQKRYGAQNQQISAPAYEGLERTFLIDENSPALIDLGDIELPPAR